MTPDEDEAVFIPQSKAELMQAFNSTSPMDRDALIVTIFTDYKRTNKSHFWSETSQNWWNLENESQLMDNADTLKFKEWVTCDGYKKLTNTLDEKACICIGTISYSFI